MKTSSKATCPLAVKKAVAQVIRKYRYLNPYNLRTIVGVSGGADSVALLKCISLAADDVIAVHVVHDIRSYEETQVDKEIARKAAELCGTDFLSINIYPKKELSIVKDGDLKSNIEHRARERRYQALSRICNLRLQSDKGKSFIRRDFNYSKNCCAIIATAHHSDDQLETLLMKFGRGAGLKGMSGISESLDRPPFYLGEHSIIRPMLSITRKDTEDICSYFNLPWIVDQTNLSDDYTRNNIRNNIVPLLKEIYPKISQHAYNFARISASANSLVEKTSYKELMFHINSCPGNWEQVKTDALCLQEDIVIYRWIQHACQSCCNGGPVDFDRVNNKMAEDLFQAIKKKKTKIFYWSTRAIEVNPEMVTVRVLNAQERKERQEGFQKPKL